MAAKLIRNSVLLAVASLLSIGSSAQQGLSTRRQAEQEIFQRILRPGTYDKDINPGGDETSGRTNVTVSVYVRDVMKIDDHKQEMVTQLILRQQWLDSRLAYTDRRIGADGDPSTFLVLTDLSQLWRPDLFIANDIESRRHDFAKVNAYARIYPDGTVFISERLTVTTRCLMDFRNFPFDSQTCSLRMASYGYTERDVVFQWKKADPIQVTSEPSLTSYGLMSFETDNCDSSTNTGIYSCITVRFGFTRLVNYYLVQVFIPVVMMTLLSFPPFWVDSENILARLLIHLLALFVMAVQTSRFNEQFPKVSYNKAIDIYTGVSLTFAFLALMETFTVNYMRRKECRKLSEGKPTAGTTDEDLEAEALNVESDGPGGARADAAPKKGRKNGYLNAVKNRMESLLSKSGASKKMDVIARLVFPLTFSFFLITYFAVYYSSYYKPKL